jgi:hypothetical protein
MSPTPDTKRPMTFTDVVKAHPGDPAAQLAAITEAREQSILELPDPSAIGNVIRLTSVMAMLRAQADAEPKAA